MTNVAPTATFANNGPKRERQPVTFNFTSPTDPSSIDTTAGFKYSYDFNNDGTFDVVDSASPTATFTFSHEGSFPVKGRIKDKDGGLTDYTTTVTVTNVDIVVTGADAGGGPHVIVRDAVTNAVKFSFFAYNANFTGGVRVATGDFNGDGIPDIVAAAGPRRRAEHPVFDGVDRHMLAQLLRLRSDFTGGVIYLAVGDVNGDGHARHHHGGRCERWAARESDRRHQAQPTSIERCDFELGVVGELFRLRGHVYGRRARGRGRCECRWQGRCRNRGRVGRRAARRGVQRREPPNRLVQFLRVRRQLFGRRVRCGR